MVDIFSGIIFLGFGQAMLMAIAQLAQKNRTQRNYLFAGFFLSLAIIQLGIFNVGEGFSLRYGFLAEIDVPLLFTAGPFIYLLYKQVIVKGFRIRAWHSLLFTPGLIALALMVPFYLKEPAEKAAIMKSIFTQFSGTTLEYLFAAGLVMNVVYIAIMIKGAALLFNFNTLKNEAGARILVLLLCSSVLVFGLVIAGAAATNYNLIRLAVSLIAMGLFFMYIMGQRYGELFEAMQNMVEKEKYQRSLIKDLDLGALENRIKNLMVEEKAYAEVDLTLKSLAEKLQLTSHQLSQFLNEHLQQNFNTFLNQYRVEEAERLLKAEPDRSAVSVGYEVGYNNYTTFQLAFRKVTGLSPKKYREGKS